MALQINQKFIKKIEELLYVEKQQLKKTYASAFQKGSSYDYELEKISEIYLENTFGIKRRQDYLPYFCIMSNNKTILNTLPQQQRPNTRLLCVSYMLDDTWG